MEDLSTEEGRRKAVEKIERDFIRSVCNAGIELSKDVVVRVKENNIEIGLSATGDCAERGFKMEFASEVTFYCGSESFGRREDSLGYGTTVSFNPSNRNSYWRTIHAASILKNWDSFCLIAKDATDKYSELVKKVFENNQG